MKLLVDVVSGTLMVTASLFVLLAALGLHRFDDVFSRIHAATKSITFGAVLVSVGAAFHMDHVGDIAVLVLAVAFQLLSAPVGSHILARAAYHSGGELSPATRIDELAEQTDNSDSSGTV
ncbi:MAG: monovalent cation/H(+) antiporter subunit G [Microthrixaceae bacterium]